MARKVFYSFHFLGDHWRASQVRQIGAIEGNGELSDNDWEAVKKRGNAAIENWIDSQMSGRSCVVVLVGNATAGRQWINYEILKGWNSGKGVLGIRIHRLLNAQQQSSSAGANPFSGFNVKGTPLSSLVTLYDPPGADSRAVYKSISDSIANLVENAITFRANYKA
jgi:MTH538 TIR-like domain (DUF1863)